jgi:RNA polymerase sigma factor (sigma-70 family)
MKGVGAQRVATNGTGTVSPASEPPSRTPVPLDRDDALTRLYEEQLAPMVRLAHLITGSNLAAQDLVHDAFVKVGARLDELDTPAAYLRVAVVNECRSWLRHRVVVDRHDRATVPGVEPEPELPAEMSRVWHAMRLLSERQRVAVVLRFWLDLPVAEVADLMSCPTGTVKSLVHRALHILEQELRDDER